MDIWDWIHRGEQLGGEDHAIRVHHDADAGVGPVIEHVLVVILGAFPEADDRRGRVGSRDDWLRRRFR